MEANKGTKNWEYEGRKSNILNINNSEMEQTDKNTELNTEDDGDLVDDQEVTKGGESAENDEEIQHQPETNAEVVEDSGDNPESTPEGPEAEQVLPDYFNGSYKVLVIDDDKWIQRIFKQYLETWGFEYVGAMSSIEGLKMALEEKPIAIFLDIVLPDVYGDITLKFIKGYEECKHAPLVIISGSLNKNMLRQTYQDGASSFITKPFNKETLKEKMVSIINPAIITKMKEDGKLIDD